MRAEPLPRAKAKRAPLRKQNGDLAKNTEEDLLRWSQWIEEIFQVSQEELIPKTSSIPIETWEQVGITEQDISQRYTEIHSIRQKTALRRSIHSSIHKKSLFVNVIMRPFSTDEILNIIKYLPKNKAHGTDGLPAELFQAIGTHIAPVLQLLRNNPWKEIGLPQE